MKCVTKAQNVIKHGVSVMFRRYKLGTTCPCDSNIYSFLNMCHIIVDSSYPSQPLSDYVHIALDTWGCCRSSIRLCCAHIKWLIQSVRRFVFSFKRLEALLMPQMFTPNIVFRKGWSQMVENTMSKHNTIKVLSNAGGSAENLGLYSSLWQNNVKRVRQTSILINGEVSCCHLSKKANTMRLQNITRQKMQQGWWI